MRCFAVLGLVALSFVGNAFAQHDCGEGWTLIQLDVEGAVCVATSGHWLSFGEARQHCADVGGRMVHPYSKAEEDSLFENLGVTRFYVDAMRKVEDGLIWSSYLDSNQEKSSVEWVNLPDDAGKKAKLEEVEEKSEDGNPQLVCSAPESWNGVVKFKFRHNNILVDHKGPVLEVKKDGQYSCVAIQKQKQHVTISNALKVVDGAVVKESEICAFASKDKFWRRVPCNSDKYHAQAVCTKKYDSTPSDDDKVEETENKEEAGSDNKEEAEKEEDDAAVADIKALKRKLLKTKLIEMLKKELKNI